MAVTPAETILAATALAAGSGVGWIWLARAGLRRWGRERRATLRSTEGERAAVEASVDAVAFAPDAVRQAVGRILQAAESLWAGAELHGVDDRERREVADWATDHGRGAGTHLRAEPQVDLLQVINRGDANGRIEIRVRGTIHAGQTRSWLAPQTASFDERWTLVQREHDWALQAYDSHPLAADVLYRPQIVGSWDDRERLWESSLAELAAGDTAAGSCEGGRLVDPDEEPRQQLLDLSLIDGHFAPAFIEAVLTHLVDSWEQAAVGSEQALADVSTLRARRGLLNPDPQQQTTFVLRDAQLIEWRPVRITDVASGTQVGVELRISGIRTLVDREGRHLAGSSDVRHNISLRWGLERVGNRDTPWRLASTTDPSVDVPNKPWD